MSARGVFALQRAELHSEYVRGLTDAARACCALCEETGGDFGEGPILEHSGWWHGDESCEAAPIHDLLIIASVQ